MMYNKCGTILSVLVVEMLRGLDKREYGNAARSLVARLGWMGIARFFLGTHPSRRGLLLSLE